MHLFPLLNILALSEAHADNFMCQLGVGVARYDASLDVPPSKDMQEKMDAITRALLLEVAPSMLYGAFTLKENTTAPRLFSMRTGEERAKVIYSREFVDTVTQQYGAEALVGILGHAFGHYLDIAANPPRWMDNSLTTELRADALAGCVLAKGAYEKEPLEKALQALADYPAPLSPQWSARVGAIQKGYESCGGSPNVIGAMRVDNTRRCEERSTAAYESCVKSIPAIVEECIEYHRELCVDNCLRQAYFTRDQCAMLTCSRDNPQNEMAWKQACHIDEQQCEERRRTEYSSCVE